jgi:farnesyl diphosphate synthase
MQNNNKLLELFNDYCKNNLPQVKNSFHPNYNKGIKDIMLMGGKRFRPLLYLSIVNTYQPLLLRNSLPVALGIEMLHTYSLIHDDLPAMDNADKRRGIDTLHKTYNDGFAILIGDALLTESFFVITNASLSSDTKIGLIKELSLNTGLSGMVYGQALDLFYENKKLEIDKIKTLHINKTAKYIASSLKMGAITCGLDKIKRDILYNFGLHLGLLFQIQDDILDVTSSEDEALKSINKDEDKNSFVTLLGLDESIKEANTYRDEIISLLNDFDDDLKYNLQDLLQGYLNRHI